MYVIKYDNFHGCNVFKHYLYEFETLLKALNTNKKIRLHVFTFYSVQIIDAMSQDSQVYLSKINFTE